MDSQNDNTTKKQFRASKTKSDLWLTSIMVQKEIIKTKKSYASLETTIREIESEQIQLTTTAFESHRASELCEARQELWDARLKLKSLLFINAKVSECMQGAC
jgi:hypothetical protein